MASDDILTLFEKVSRFSLFNISTKINPPSTATVIFLLSIYIVYFLYLGYRFGKNHLFDCFVEEISCAYVDCSMRPCVIENMIFYSGLITYKLLAASALFYNELKSKNSLFDILQNLNAINNNFVNYLSMEFPLQIYGYVIFSLICLRLAISCIFIYWTVSSIDPHIIEGLVDNLFGFSISMYLIIEFVLLLILNKQLNLMSQSVKKCQQGYRLIYLQIFETHGIFDNFFGLTLLSGVFFIFGAFLMIAFLCARTEIDDAFNDYIYYLITSIVQVSAVVCVGIETEHKVCTLVFQYVIFFFGNFHITKIIAQYMVAGYIYLGPLFGRIPLTATSPGMDQRFFSCR